MVETDQKVIWDEHMVSTLREEYAAAFAQRRLRELAQRLGVGLDQLYRKAYKLGLSREIRRR